MPRAGQKIRVQPNNPLADGLMQLQYSDVYIQGNPSLRLYRGSKKEMNKGNKMDEIGCTVENEEKEWKSFQLRKVTGGTTLLGKDSFPAINEFVN